MHRHASVLPLALAIFGTAQAGFNPSTPDNIAAYWGQNSIGRPTGQPGAQEGLGYYCKNVNVDIIPLAFLNIIVNPTNINFANVGDRCSKFPGTNLLKCPEVEADINTCHSLNKTILLSVGGATYSEGGFPTVEAANKAADNLWAMFGPPPATSTNDAASVNRPFGTAYIDGFDLDFETHGINNLAAFARRLRQVMDTATRPAAVLPSNDNSYPMAPPPTTNDNSYPMTPSPNEATKKFYLAAAPQCVFPDAAMDVALSSDVAFDFIMVQFYNNYCGLQNFQPGAAQQNAFNFERWDQWAREKGRSTKVLLGVPGSPTASGSGYTASGPLDAIIKYSRRFPSFGGVMIWDASQVWSNNGFLDGVVRSLGGAATDATDASEPQAPPQAGRPIQKTRAVRVPRFGRCGGRLYTGPTECEEGFKCVYGGALWSVCA
ncbi:uncharacterized protein PpBr36_09662 [Pyricularia pennisetigena]|uniref:uncharacterized protein n=1 Tax=Pyricularia pennisetigena TaxID=1578925 RepID=UPI001154CB94|nr:uncharacterized protein PpBr36_09662 [Pyricularia pennisetigena]TLS22130.1 hypothetical protein PpBr36_09662 [Pyricularia pennisetigena]